MWGRDSQGVWDGHGHTAVFNMENQQGPAVQHRELSAPCHVAAWLGGEFGEEGMRVYICLSPFAVYVVDRLYCSIKYKAFYLLFFLENEPGCWNGFHIVLREHSPDHYAHFSWKLF